jgi:hypothetical protein
MKRNPPLISQANSKPRIIESQSLKLLLNTTPIIDNHLRVRTLPLRFTLFILRVIRRRRMKKSIFRTAFRIEIL